MEETNFRMFPISEDDKSMFETFPRLDIQAAVEIFSECIDYRLIANQALKTFHVPS